MSAAFNPPLPVHWFAVLAVAAFAWAANQSLALEMLRPHIAIASGALAASVVVAWCWAHAPDQPAIGAGITGLAAVIGSIAPLL